MFFKHIRILTALADISHINSLVIRVINCFYIITNEYTIVMLYCVIIIMLGVLLLHDTILVLKLCFFNVDGVMYFIHLYKYNASLAKDSSYIN